MLESKQSNKRKDGTADSDSGHAETERHPHTCYIPQTGGSGKTAHVDAFLDYDPSTQKADAGNDLCSDAPRVNARYPLSAQMSIFCKNPFRNNHHQASPGAYQHMGAHPCRAPMFFAFDTNEGAGGK